MLLKRHRRQEKNERTNNERIINYNIIDELTNYTVIADKFI